MIELFKDGDNMAIRTDCEDESDFTEKFVKLLSDLIESDIESGGAPNGFYSSDWEFQLGFWLPQFVELCCKYRGYKAEVQEKKILVAGDLLVNSVAHKIDSRGVVQNYRTGIVDGELPLAVPTGKLGL